MDLEQLLAVGDLDTRIAQLEHQLDHDAVHEALAGARAALAATETEILELFGRRDAVRQELKRLEDEAGLIEDKIARDNATLYGGVVTTHKELEALQAEIAMLKERLSEFEDHELEQMELAEPLDARSAELEVQKAAQVSAVDAAEGAVTVMQAEVGAELDSVRQERADLAAALPEALVAQYDTSRRISGGQGVARLAPGGRCEGCHLTLPTAEYDALKRAPADEVHLCPECSRILVR